MNYKTIKTISVAIHLLAAAVISSQVQAEQKSNADFKLTNKYIKKSIEMGAFDEASLKWRDITISKDAKFGCATFNGKNRYGAYAGYQTVGFGVLEDNTVGVTPNYELCYEMLSAHNYRNTPEGRIKYEQQQKALKDAEKLREQEIAENNKKTAQEIEDRRILREQEETQRIADNEKYNKELEEKQARDKAEMDELIRLDRLKNQSTPAPSKKLENLVPKKLFDLLPK
ncbi:MAG: hypothetical protein Q8J66_06385 [Methylotenera sp.]|nr:hypothetical protein [Methylotenera sp.]